ncbi:apolipoprotein C-I [Cheilinus undulatus]|uniref:apolipoprotein C-I n=1 Tax=Cheilinus undulatus TaxID=241271 RepID=UPI001BD333C2|nr:apolipoprotein C-I [Cheilinus undulatus]
MRLFLAVAVLMLAFIAYTEAQEETFEEKMTNFGNQMTEFFRGVVERANAGIEDMKNSQAVTDARSWAEKLSERLMNNFQRPGQ